MTDPFISLVLATVGRCDQLGRLVDSLALQSFNDFELVVVDQNLDQRIESQVQRAESLGLRVRYQKLFPPNLATARNRGIETSTGEWIGFPDDDCWYDPSLLQTVVSRISGIDKPGGLVGRWAELQAQPTPSRKLELRLIREFRETEVSSITLFFHSTLLRRIGGFDSRFGLGQWFGAGEETDLVFRALEAGASIVYEPSAEVHHDLPGARNRALQNVRSRSRGTGGLYAKHHISAWVVLRGLLSPLLVPLFRGRFQPEELLRGMVTIRGRAEGLLRWRWSNRQPASVHRSRH